jgi:hypothetical protein
LATKKGFQGETITQHPPDFRRFERAAEVENLKGVRRSREREAASREVKTLWRRRSGQLAAVSAKRERGWSRHINRGGRLARQETPEGRKPKEVTAGAVQLNIAYPGGISAVCEALKEREHSRCSPTPRGRRRSRERTAPSEGAKPRRANPMSGTGMKQARQAMRGAKRREGEKP